MLAELKVEAVFSRLLLARDELGRVESYYDFRWLWDGNPLAPTLRRSGGVKRRRGGITRPKLLEITRLRSSESKR